ncbi:hypothetical protein [Rubritalea tangerina]|uniref:Uncharacterized protein n=1 Tax=Rubritalea tangerina TaxID=430798 RepID=A0ABW4ZBF7_9BACT
MRNIVTLLGALIALNSSPLSAKAPSSHTETWLKLSITSQNVGHQIHMMGVDAEPPNTKQFTKEIKEIDALLDQLVKNGVLKQERFELKPELDIEESVIIAVSKLIEKYAPQYGIYTIREMMDVGARQRLRQVDEDKPLILNVRMPEEFLAEFKALLHKKGFNQ